ncbi:hypothetical protein R9C00_09270 [Flammeovirgaceae bacterium SG7u.111]|nr:hypothetical protein [Flammeovirgaceae bacterium SG7u.132]WPO37639.1 hypothetical protein R9C00_09270 [Flammeovirgaceae bacterium SG7u.111]
MKKYVFLLLLIIPLELLAQEVVRPANINVSAKDIQSLGITFDDSLEKVKVNFQVTDVELEFNKKNLYVMYYNESINMIEFGCITEADPSNKGIYMLNEKFYIPVTPPQQQLQIETVRNELK